VDKGVMKMGKKGISIIIITYNRKEELKCTLSKLVKMQSVYPYEIIIIDQNSNDETSTLFDKNFENVRYIRLDKNLGVAGGRNLGASYAQYEFMVFIDDDAHFLENEALNQIFEYMEGEKADLFAFQIRNLDGGLYNWPYSSGKKKMVNKAFKANKFIGCGHAIKKSFFENVNGYSECLFFWGEETELVLKAFATTQSPVLYNGKIKIMHRVHENGRNNTDRNRFYYQVRNRLYIIDSLMPKCVHFLKLYYKLGYFIKAIRKGWTEELFRGIKNVNQMPRLSIKKINLRNLIRYFILNF
jgi:GT2 family glycosyltransferase